MKWDYRFENKYRAVDGSELPPGYQLASGIREKLSAYSLNPEHVTGRHKAVVFDSALGYNAGNAEDLEREIRKGLTHYLAIEAGDKGFGPKYHVTMLISGPKGKQPVCTGWILEAERFGPRMVNAIVEKENRRP